MTYVRQIGKYENFIEMYYKIDFILELLFTLIYFTK